MRGGHSPQQQSNRVISIYSVERKGNTISWARTSDLVKVGFLKDAFDYRTVKRLCAESFGLSTEPDKLVLIHAGARVDHSAFPTLGQYLGALSPQQRAKFSLGVGEIDDGSGFEEGTDGNVRSRRSLSRTTGNFSHHSRSSRYHPSRTRSRSPSSSGASQQSSSLHHQSPSQTEPFPALEGLQIPVYTYQQLCYVTSDLSDTNLLGSGGFGKVYVGKLRQTMVAIKMFSQNNEELVDKLTFLKSEAGILSHYHHPNLVTILGVCTDKDHPAVVYELMSNGSLWDWLFHKRQDGRKLGDILRRMTIMHEAATGLAYLHSSEGGMQPIIHLDVKSSNILLNSNMQAKLGDFGFARPLPKRAAGRSFAVTNDICGTEGFIAPEFYRGEVGPKVDVFAFGITLLEIFSERRAYNPRREVPYLHDIFHDPLQSTEQFSDLVGDALRQTEVYCLIPYSRIQSLAQGCLNPRHTRLTMDQVVDILDGIIHEKLIVQQ